MPFLVFFISFIVGEMSIAVPTVIRTLQSSPVDYQNYLKKSGAQSFIESYILISSLTEIETPLLEKCLEEVYLGAPSAETCLEAVKSLTAKPLNPARREMLFAFLLKLEKTKSSHKVFFRSLEDGLIQTHPQLAETFQTKFQRPNLEPNQVQELEMKAWKKALSRIIPLSEVALLVNGKKVSKLESWSAPSGIFQWSLITNTHEPLTRLGTFSQFALESLHDLVPLTQNSSCEELQHQDVPKFGIVQLEVFSTAKCVARFGPGLSLAQENDHFAPAKARVKLESQESNYRHWVWPAMALVTVGVAASLKNKQVSIQMPTFR